MIIFSSEPARQWTAAFATYVGTAFCKAIAHPPRGKAAITRFGTKPQTKNTWQLFF